VTATEAERNRRRGLIPWWRGRTWGKDLETLTRLHRSLQALDAEVDAKQEPLSAPVLLTPPDERPAAEQSVAEQSVAEQSVAEQSVAEQSVAEQSVASQDLTTPPQDLTTPPADLTTPPDEVAEEADEPELTPVADRPSPAAVAEASSAPDPAIAAIKETFRYVAEAGDKAVGFFYGQLFLRQPQLRLLFPPAMDEQRDRLFRALGRIVESLSTPDEMAAYLSQLGRDHRKYRVEPEMYEAVGAALLATLRSFARDAFTSEAEEAWTAVYQAGSSLMIKAAEEDAARSPASWTAEVVMIEHRADDIAVLIIAPDQPLPFTAGQHLTVQHPRWPRVWRPYSIARMPRDDGLLALHVKAIPGGWVSNALVHHTAPGSELVLGPPLGTMTLAGAGNRDLLCVAGGTGLSPIKAIIEQAVRESSATPRRICLYYGARRRHELYDLPDLWRLQDAYSGFELIPVTSDDPAFEGMQGNVGRVAARYMPHTDCDAYVAGPPEMVRETIRVLARSGMERDRIHFDDALLADKPRAGTGT
jgi:NAD(P)H-flavin reductase/hemoglobin-like flavoprotein